VQLAERSTAAAVIRPEIGCCTDESSVPRIRICDQRHESRVATVEVDIDVVPNVDLNGDVDVESLVDVAHRPRGQFTESSSNMTRERSRSRQVEDRVNVNVAAD
jgi:hypothetical protein